MTEPNLTPKGKINCCQLCGYKSFDSTAIVLHVRQFHPVEYMLAKEGKFSMNPEKK